MADYLKRGATAEAKADADRKVRDVVEATLADIRVRRYGHRNAPYAGKADPLLTMAD
jgi:hypothetical protein